jgi:hypothetical protein
MAGGIIQCRNKKERNLEEKETKMLGVQEGNRKEQDPSLNA